MSLAIDRGKWFCEHESLPYEKITESKDEGINIASFYFRKGRVVLMFTDCEEDYEVGVWVAPELRSKAHRTCEHDFDYAQGLPIGVLNLIEGKEP